VQRAFIEVKERFPFKGYMEPKLSKYYTVSSLLMEQLQRGARILDIGCGPCDVSAILTKLGYKVTGIDDLRDPWHLIGRNKERILKFAREFGIELIASPMEKAELEKESFDAVLLLDILEHVLKPRYLLNKALSLLRAGGLLVVETPNAAMLAKRILLLLGKSNQTDLNFILYNIGPYRSHIREYTSKEVKTLLEALFMTEVKIKMTNDAVNECASAVLARLPRLLMKLYGLVSNIYPNFRSTIIAYSRKPQDWKPLDDLMALARFKRIYSHIAKWNLDQEDDVNIIEKLKQLNEK